MADKFSWRASQLDCFAVAMAIITFCTDAEAQQYFNVYPCTQDCSGHQAGYRWAEENGITDPDECGGNSQSFIEGCQSYAEENPQPQEYEYLGDDGGEDAEDSDGEDVDGL